MNVMILKPKKISSKILSTEHKTVTFNVFVQHNRSGRTVTVLSGSQSACEDAQGKLPPRAIPSDFDSLNQVAPS